MSLLKLFIVFAIIAFYQNTSASEEMSLDTTQFNILLGSQVTLRALVNDNNFFYFNNEHQSYYEIDDDRLFLYHKNQHVRIDSIYSGEQARRTRGPYASDSISENPLNQINIKIENKLLGSQLIILHSGTSDGITNALFEQFMNTAFIKDSTSDEFAPYAINDNTGTIHSTLCNHLLKTELYRFETKLEPQDSTYLCAACFRMRSTIDDLDFELLIGHETSNYFLSYNSIVADDSLQYLIDSLGQMVLSKWPFPKRGYKYRFSIVDNMGMNALACPGGIIFINLGLLRTIDNQQELVAVLCHEIAHVEFRHGYREYKSAQSAAFWTSVAAAMAGTIIASTTDNSNVQIAAYEITRSIINLFGNIILNGYSREYEMEADRVSELFSSLHSQEKQPPHLSNVIKKIRYASNEDPTSKREFSSTHPTNFERLRAMEESELKIYDSPIVFTGIDKDSNIVATFTLLGEKPFALSRVFSRGDRHREYEEQYFESIVFSVLKTTEYLRSGCEAKDFKFKNMPLKFDNKEDTKIYPLSEQGILFYNSSREPINAKEMVDLDFELNKVYKWIKDK